MKPRKIIVAMEITTDEKTADLKSYLRDALTDRGATVHQVQTNAVDTSAVAVRRKS